MRLRVPLRWRLNLFYAALLMGIYVLLAILLYTSVDNLLVKNAADFSSHQLEAASNRVGAPKPVVPGAPRDVPPLDPQMAANLVGTISGPGTSAIIYDGNGVLLASSDNTAQVPSRTPTTAEVVQAAHMPFGQVGRYVNNFTPRTLTMLIPLPHNDVVQLTFSLATADALLGQLRWLLVAGFVLALLAILLLGLPLLRAALRPLDRIAATADRLAAGDLSSRADPAQPHDEVGRLATSFNHMADQLEQSFRRQHRFVADAGHELKTPLTALGGEVEMMLLGMDGSDPAARQRLLRSMQRELGRMNRLVVDLLTLSRSDDPGSYPLHPQQLDLRTLLGEVGEQVRLLAPDHQVICNLPPNPVMVSADPDRLRQVLLNIGDNARKFSPLGSAITFSLQAASDHAEVSIANEGHGIAAEHLPHIFERFYRADGARSGGAGAGLGLSIAQTLAQAHGGTLAVSSAPDQGATFILGLPLAHELLALLTPELNHNLI